MNRLKQRFKNNKEKNEYNKSRPISIEREQEIIKLTEQKCFRMLNAFASLEYSLTKLVLHALGLDLNKEVWEKNHEEYKGSLSKIFSIHDIRGMIRQLIKEGTLIENESAKNIQLPTSFKSSKTVNYLEALEIAFGYRNTLAHESYIFYYIKDNGRFKIAPILEARKYQIEKGYPTINILENSIVDKEGKLIHLSFMDFLGRLTLGLPPHGITGMRYEIAKTPNAAEFIEKRIGKAKKTMESMLKGKIKKIEKFIDRINEDYK